jgi:hypothetical protein
VYFEWRTLHASVVREESSWKTEKGMGMIHKNDLRDIYFQNVIWTNLTKNKFQQRAYLAASNPQYLLQRVN